MVKYSVNFGTDWIEYKDVGISNTEDIVKNNNESKVNRALRQGVTYDR